MPHLELLAKQSVDPEVRTRAESLLEQIELNDKQYSLLKVEPVSIELDRVPLAVAVNEFQKLANIQMNVDAVADPLRLVSVKIDQLPPWEALEQFCQAAKLKEVFHTEIVEPVLPENLKRLNSFRRTAYSVELTPSHLTHVPVYLADATSTVKRLDGNRSTAVRVMAMPGRFRGNRVLLGNGEIVLNLDVTPISKVQWEQVRSVRVDRAEDETGRPVLTSHRSEMNGMFGPEYMDQVFQFGIVSEVYGSQMPALQNHRCVPVRLITGDRRINRLKVLEGAVIGNVALTNQSLLEVNNISKEVGQLFPIDEYSEVKVTNCHEKQGITYITLESETANMLTLSRLNNFNGGGMIFNGRQQTTINGMSDVSGIRLAGNIGTAQFYDAEGKLIKRVFTPSTTTHDDGLRQSQELELQFPKGSVPAKMVVVGQKSVRVSIPFRMTDVELP